MFEVLEVELISTNKDVEGVSIHLYKFRRRWVDEDAEEKKNQNRCPGMSIIEHLFGGKKC